MIGMYGPHWERRVDRRKELGNYEPRDEPPFQVEATTLGEAIRAYEKAFGVSVTPYDGSDPLIPFEDGEPPKYFFLRGPEIDKLVDIHVFRGQDRICPKQDLGFPLNNNDVVELGELIC